MLIKKSRKRVEHEKEISISALCVLFCRTAETLKKSEWFFFWGGNDRVGGDIDRKIEKK